MRSVLVPRWPVVLLVLLCGCGSPASRDWADVTSAGESAGVKPAYPREPAAEADRGSALAAGAAPQATLPDGERLERKIIYTADVDLVVEQFDPVPEQVKELVKKFGGYVARSNLSGSPGQRRVGEWTLRVPVERFEECLTAARGLGELRALRSDSQDVSEEFYDLEARIRNKKDQEERLRRHLADSTAKLEDILAVEREIARVREEIERMEGRVRVLSDLTSLTTIRLRIEEIRGYVPEEAPTYATRVGRAFYGSLSSLVSTAERVSIAAVAVAPWIPVVLVVLLLAVWLLKRCWRLLFGRRA
jgi:hypothetical protein